MADVSSKLTILLLFENESHLVLCKHPAFTSKALFKSMPLQPSSGWQYLPGRLESFVSIGT